jgi:hypothetical protein
MTATDAAPMVLSGTAGLDARQRCMIRRVVREAAGEPLGTVERVIE